MKPLFLFDVILTKLLDRMIEFSTEEQNFEPVREEEQSIHSLCFKPNKLKNVTNRETKGTTLEGDDSHALFLWCSEAI